MFPNAKYLMVWPMHSDSNQYYIVVKRGNSDGLVTKRMVTNWVRMMKTRFLRHLKGERDERLNHKRMKITVY